MSSKENESAKSNETLVKTDKINKSNLKKIDFKLVDSFSDPILGYETFQHQKIEVTIQKESMLCELIIDRVGVKMEGVKTLSDIIDLKRLMYAK